MPIYEYECDECRKQCEVLQKFNDDPMHTCPECGGAMHKLISQTSFVLKGTGWYVTDYARAHDKKTGESKGSTPSVSQKQTATKNKAETKPKPAA